MFNDPVLILLLLIAGYLLLYGLAWLYSRFLARRCPRCGSRWRTELMGEWGGEQWKCHSCNHWWDHS